MRNGMRVKRLKLGSACIAGLVCLAPIGSYAQQYLSLPPLPGVWPVPEYMMPGSGTGFAGLATFYMGQPVIFYDGVWVARMGGVGSPGFRFLRAHEYAHHARGHGLTKLSSPPALWPLLGYHEELDADCAAVRHLRQVGDMAAIKAGFELYMAILPPDDTGGRPGARARTTNMQQC